MNIVELNQISKTYDTKVAVDALSLQIEAGKMFGLLGPNGAGKTSTIRMMIGITMPDSGTVTLFGQPFSRKNLTRVGYLPEERGLYKKMKVIDQLVFLGQLHGLDATQANSRAREWCERLQILDAIELKTEELSKGMQQKIQFISTLLHEPALIIMDEPFSGLDPVNTQLLQETLLELKNAGKAILFSTHRMDQVEKLCDSICLVDGGNAVLSGGMRELKSRYPRNHVVIDFEGDNSFVNHPAVGVQSLRRTCRNSTARRRGRTGPAAGGLQNAKIYKFELMEPSLEEIFIQTVGRRVHA